MASRLIIDLLRHGACEDGDIYRGRTDSALSTQGWAQMDRVLNKTEQQRWQQLYCSPLQRCRLPAQQFAERSGLPLTIETRLQELDFGRWEGQLQSEVWQQHPGEVQQFWADPEASPPPGGEAIQSLQQRVAAVIEEWSLVSREQASAGHILAITHGGVIRAILCQLLQIPMRIGQQLSLDYGSLTRVELYPQPVQERVGSGFYSQVFFVNRTADLNDQVSSNE